MVAATGGYDLRWEGMEDYELLARLSDRTPFHVLTATAFVYQRRRESLSGQLPTRSERIGRLLGRDDRQFRAVVRVAGARIEVASDARRPLDVIAETLPLEPHAGCDLERGVELRSRSVPRRWTDLGLDSESLWHLGRFGITHRLDRTRRFAGVLIDPARRPTADLIYHAAFLHPLSRLLHETGATLVHAALVARGASGVLIMGESGCGKSTLSLALLRSGYTYFSDEHPVLALEADAVIGRGFANRIGVSGVSLGNFPELRTAATWSRARRKWYLAPEAVWPASIGQTCSVDTVLFPALPGTRLRTRRLGPLEFLGRLQQDEYYRVLARPRDVARLARETHLRLLCTEENSRCAA